MAANGSASTDADGSRVGPGLLGFLVFAGLCAALIVLYRSLRRQLRRIDFDAEGESDAERDRHAGLEHHGQLLAEGDDVFTLREPHFRFSLQHRLTPFRPQALAVHDAYATQAALAGISHKVSEQFARFAGAATV